MTKSFKENIAELSNQLKKFVDCTSGHYSNHVWQTHEVITYGNWQTQKGISADRETTCKKKYDLNIYLSKELKLALVYDIPYYRRFSMQITFDIIKDNFPDFRILAIENIIIDNEKDDE